MMQDHYPPDKDVWSNSENKQQRQEVLKIITGKYSLNKD